MSDKVAFYENLGKKLEEYHTFPSSYLFKFIIPNEEAGVKQLKNLFSSTAELTFRASNGGKYTSVTSNDVMPSVESVIEIYKQAESIKGLISL